MSKVLFVTGLPGAGKSTLIYGAYWYKYRVFDDFMADAFYDDEKFASCRHLDEITADLNAARTIVLWEVKLCVPQFRSEVVSILNQRVGAVCYEWHCFEYKPDKCIKNIRHRAAGDDMRNPEIEIQMVREFSRVYEPFPPGAKVHTSQVATHKVDVSKSIEVISFPRTARDLRSVAKIALENSPAHSTLRAGADGIPDTDGSKSKG